MQKCSAKLWLEFNQFEARLYDARIMRWNVPDPAGQFWSPYNGMGNDWINGVDPDGRSIWHPTKSGNLVADPGDNAYTLMNYVNNNGGNITFETASKLFYNHTKGNWLSNKKSNVYINFKTMYMADKHFANIHLNPFVKSIHQAQSNFISQSFALTGELTGKAGTGLEILGTGVSVIPGAQGFGGAIYASGRTLSFASDAIKIGTDINNEEYGQAIFTASTNFIGGSLIRNVVPKAKLAPQAEQIYIQLVGHATEVVHLMGKTVNKQNQ